MNIILEKSKHIQYYGYINDVFTVLTGVCESYDWYISNIEVNGSSPWGDDVREVFISGIELQKILSENKIQFIWAVFSAVPIGSIPLVNEPPFADGNGSYWQGSPQPRLKSAVFEIVCWDSSLYLLIGVPEIISTMFLQKYTDAADLDVYIKKNS